MAALHRRVSSRIKLARCSTTSWPLTASISGRPPSFRQTLSRSQPISRFPSLATAYAVSLRSSDECTVCENSSNCVQSRCCETICRVCRFLRYCAARSHRSLTNRSVLFWVAARRVGSIRISTSPTTCLSTISGARISANPVGLPAPGTPSMAAPGGTICGWVARIMQPSSASCGCERVRPSSRPVSPNSKWCWSFRLPLPSSIHSAPPLAATAAMTRFRNSTWNSGGWMSDSASSAISATSLRIWFLVCSSTPGSMVSSAMGVPGMLWTKSDGPAGHLAPGERYGRSIAHAVSNATGRPASRPSLEIFEAVVDRGRMVGNRGPGTTCALQSSAKAPIQPLDRSPTKLRARNPTSSKRIDPMLGQSPRPTPVDLVGVRRRTLTLADSMILVGATALGATLALPIEVTILSVASARFDRSLIGVYQYVALAAAFAVPFLVCWTIALLGLRRLRPPRKLSGHRGRMALGVLGWALLAEITMVATNAHGLTLVTIKADFPWDSRPEIVLLYLFGSIPIGSGIACSWITLRAAGIDNPSHDWIERYARGLGWCWIGITPIAFSYLTAIG